MGVWVRGLALALGVLAGCAPFPGEKGGPVNYVSFTANHGWGRGRTIWAIDENDRVTYFTYDDGRVVSAPPKITDMRRAAHVEGAYQAIVDMMNAADVQTLRRLCYDENDPEFVERSMPTDIAYAGAEWFSEGNTYNFSSSFFMCRGGSDPELNELSHAIISAIKNTVGNALGIDP